MDIVSSIGVLVTRGPRAVSLGSGFLLAGKWLSHKYKSHADSYVGLRCMSAHSAPYYPHCALTMRPKQRRKRQVPAQRIAGNRVG